MATASTAEGAKLWRSTDDITYNQITGAFNLNTPGNQKERLEVTGLTDAAKQYITGLPDPTTVSFSIYADSTDTQHQALAADDNAGVTRYWLVEVPEQGEITLTHYSFQGYLQNYSLGLNVNSPQSASGEIVLTSAITIAHTQTAQA